MQIVSVSIVFFPKIYHPASIIRHLVKSLHGCLVPPLRADTVLIVLRNAVFQYDSRTDSSSG